MSYTLEFCHPYWTMLRDKRGGATRLPSQRTADSAIKISGSINSIDQQIKIFIKREGKHEKRMREDLGFGALLDVRYLLPYRL